MAEFDTAVRCNLPFVAVVGNDATWNAEHQIQLREYGPNRTHGCELLPSRYDLVVQALGGHGELVTSAADLPSALERAIASGKPACVNVMIERVPAPSSAAPSGSDSLSSKNGRCRSRTCRHEFHLTPEHLRLEPGEQLRLLPVTRSR